MNPEERKKLRVNPGKSYWAEEQSTEDVYRHGQDAADRLKRIDIPVYDKEGSERGAGEYGEKMKRRQRLRRQMFNEQPWLRHSAFGDLGSPFEKD